MATLAGSQVQVTRVYLTGTDGQLLFKYSLEKLILPKTEQRRAILRVLTRKVARENREMDAKSRDCGAHSGVLVELRN